MATKQRQKLKPKPKQRYRYTISWTVTGMHSTLTRIIYEEDDKAAWARVRNLCRCFGRTAKVEKLVKLVPKKRSTGEPD